MLDSRNVRKSLYTLYSNYYEMKDGYCDNEWLLSAISENLRSKDGIEWELQVCNKELEYLETNEKMKSIFYIQFIKNRNYLEQMLNEFILGKRVHRKARGK